MSLHILVDGRAVGPAGHGIARYVVEILRQWGDLAPDLRVTVIAHPEQVGRFRELGASDVVASSLSFASPMAPLLLARIQRSARPEVTFCPSFVVPAVPRRPLVMTLHDTTHLRFPRDYPRTVGVYYRVLTLPVARRAAAVITVSAHSRLTLDAIRVPGARVIPNGVDHGVFSPEGPRDERLGPQTILYAGGFKQHKRVPLLLGAIAAIPTAHLAVVGEPPASLMGRAEELGVADRVQLLGRLTDRELAAAYRAATLFCYPSIHEGFGLPPLEAMACGTPVVACRGSSLPEVIAEAGVLVSGGASEWSAEIARLLDDPAERTRLGAAGHDRSLSFTWEKAALATAAVLRAAAG